MTGPVASIRRLDGYEGLPDDLSCALCHRPVMVHTGMDLWLCWHLLNSQRTTERILRGIFL